MSIQTQAIPDSVGNEPCRGNCSGYGARSFCPPLIVLAMHSERYASEAMLERSRYPVQPGAAQEANRLGHFAGTVASGKFCECMFFNWTGQAFAKSPM